LERNSEFGGNPKGIEKKIMDLKNGESWLTVKGRVLEAGESKLIQTRKGPRTISEAVIGDETGRVKLTLWGDKAGSLEKGTVVKIEGAWTTSYKGEVQLNAGSKSKINKIDDNEIPAEEEIPEDRPKAPRTPRQGFRPQGYGRGGYGRRW